MKYNDNAATQGFKTQVDHMQDYLKAAGIDVPRTHLMEAAARFNGARDWRTLRAELEATVSSKEFATPNLAGDTVRVYFAVHVRDDDGEGPQYCWTDIDQKWVDGIFEQRELCKRRKLSEVDSNFDIAGWMDDGAYRINTQGICVSERDFYFWGYPKGMDYKVETDPCSIDELVKLVQNVSGSELFLLTSRDSVYDIMELLARDEDHPQFVHEDEDCVININGL